MGLELIQHLAPHKVLCDRQTAKILKVGRGIDLRSLVEKADPIVTLGGDGTLIGAARLVKRKSPVMLGVNFGTLGFLTEISPEELLPTIDRVLSGKSKLGERNILNAEVLRGRRVVFKAQAVNDAVVQKRATDPLLDLDISIAKEQLVRVRSDGLIIGTPTGSTAYSLSAGGAILHPTLPVIQVTAICPHSLTFRPLVVPLDQELKVTVPPYRGDVVLTIDGQQSFFLKSGDTVRISRSKNTVTFVRSASRSYYEILRRKLNWGIANKG